MELAEEEPEAVEVHPFRGEELQARARPLPVGHPPDEDGQPPQQARLPEEECPELEVQSEPW